MSFWLQTLPFQFCEIILNDKKEDTSDQQQQQSNAQSSLFAMVAMVAMVKMNALLISLQTEARVKSDLDNKQSFQIFNLLI